MDFDMANKKSKRQSIASMGVGIVSETVGAAAGALSEQYHPGSGAIVKAGLTNLINASYKNIGGVLTKKEHVRAEEAIKVAEFNIRIMEADGKKRRDDDFFERDELSGGSKAGEFFEGSIRAAMKAYQEGKYLS